MNVANLELCRELYELSGWKKTDALFVGYKSALTDKFDYHLLDKRDADSYKHAKKVPAYDLGYLLRKLPTNTMLEKLESNIWHIELYNHPNEPIKIERDTPEDATAKLAIELFKRGILNKENPPCLAPKQSQRMQSYGNR
jgi:hypothetical protein